MKSTTPGTPLARIEELEQRARVEELEQSAPSGPGPYPDMYPHLDASDVTPEEVHALHYLYEHRDECHPNGVGLNPALSDAARIVHLAAKRGERVLAGLPPEPDDCGRSSFQSSK